MAVSSLSRQIVKQLNIISVQSPEICRHECHTMGNAKVHTWQQDYSLTSASLRPSLLTLQKGRSKHVLRHATRKDSTVISVSEDELDEDMRAGLNEVANEAIRAMLSEDIQEILDLKKKVDYYGEYLVGEGELDAARFMLVVKGMLDHKVVEEHEDLNGLYKKAFEKIGSIMEDSGWSLLPPEEEPAAAMAMVDDELIPPVLKSPY